MSSLAMDERQGKDAGPLVRERFRGAIWTLLILAPFIAEVLSGATRTSVLFVLIPEVMVWGVGALFCRELVRWWGAGGLSLVTLGLALSVAEEFIIQQTSIAPLPFPGAHADYGRMWGVNLVYFLFMLGYESVWVVVVPVQFAELFFPAKAAQPWLRWRGVAAGCVAFVLGSLLAWYGWTQQARVRMGAAPYHPPMRLTVLGFLMIAGLIGLAYALRGVGRPRPGDRRRTVPAWVAGFVAAVMAAGWFELIGQVFTPKAVQPFWVAVGAGLAWALLALALFVWWSSQPGWGERHRFAAAWGATLVCEAGSYLTLAGGLKLDLVGKMVFDAIAVALFVRLGLKVVRRTRDVVPVEEAVS